MGRAQGRAGWLSLTVEWGTRGKVELEDHGEEECCQSDLNARPGNLVSVLG